MICPNRTRHKRMGRGGGTPGCRGTLMVLMTVPVMLPLARWPRGGHGGLPPFDGAVPAKRRRHGYRLRPAELAMAYQDGDVVCSACGWSLRKLMSGLKTRRPLR